MSETLETPQTPQAPQLRTARALRYGVPLASALILFVVFTAYGVWTNLPTTTAQPASGPEASSLLRASLTDPSAGVPGLLCDLPAPEPDLAASPYGIWTVARPSGLHGETLAGVHSRVTKIISAQTLEERYGIRITLVGITNLGGMVEMRFKVTDRDRALELLTGKGHAAMPMMMLAGTTRMLAQPHMMHERHGIDMKPRGMNFVYYPNTNSVVKPGDQVSLTFGNIQVTPFTVEG